MIRDRLQELRSKMLEFGSEPIGDTVIFMSEKDDAIEELRTFIKAIDSVIEQMGYTIVEVKKMHTECLTSSSSNLNAKQSIEDLDFHFKILSKKAKESLHNLKSNCLELETNNDTNCALYRMQRMQLIFLQDKLMETVNDYNQEQLKYRDRCKEQFKRQLEITGQFTTDEQLEQLLENPDPGVFIKNILNETKLAKLELSGIQDRHEDIIKIEKSLRELHDLFVDMSNLVTQQGEVIDSIENHLRHTSDYVEQAAVQTEQALDYQRKSRKRCCILWLVLVVLLTIIIVSATT